MSEWKALPHGPLEELGPNLWTMVGEIPNMSLKRRMVIAKTSAGELVVHSAIAASDEAMAQIDALGSVAYILVPNGFHRLDASKYKERYPQAKVLCPRGAKAKVETCVATDGVYEDFPADDAVSLEYLQGVKDSEGVMSVRSGDELTLVFTDALFNVPHGKGFGGFMLKALGSSGGPKVTRIARTFLVKDKKGLADSMRNLAARSGLVRIIPGHGEIIDADAGSVLDGVAASL